MATHIDTLFNTNMSLPHASSPPHATAHPPSTSIPYTPFNNDVHAWFLHVEAVWQGLTLTQNQRKAATPFSDDVMRGRHSRLLPTDIKLHLQAQPSIPLREYANLADVLMSISNDGTSTWPAQHTAATIATLPTPMMAPPPQLSTQQQQPPLPPPQQQLPQYTKTTPHPHITQDRHLPINLHLQHLSSMTQTLHTQYSPPLTNSCSQSTTKSTP
ncbi:hypothetical protein Pcinc_013127 [Petrolisthes cinctipes]|uniref:Uncharacterized protein n=1 Tax=Petrolisthes cinctipes TaxID=88211 RepID=A0AAE1FZ51_PETCI|nr:hypothetical protein Pcinc_013127 [Petrolisthes cinctipes]